MIKNENSKIDTGLYCSGWAKTGPVGVLAAPLLQSIHKTADSILPELNALPTVVLSGGVKGYLINKNVFCKKKNPENCLMKKKLTEA